MPTQMHETFSEKKTEKSALLDDFIKHNALKILGLLVNDVF